MMESKCEARLPALLHFLILLTHYQDCSSSMSKCPICASPTPHGLFPLMRFPPNTSHVYPVSQFTDASNITPPPFFLVCIQQKNNKSSNSRWTNKRERSRLGVRVCLCSYIIIWSEISNWDRLAEYKQRNL